MMMKATAANARTADERGRAWPSREEWANDRRTVHAYMLDELDLCLSQLVATPDEIAGLRSTRRKVSRLMEAMEDLRDGDVPRDRGIDIPLLAKILACRQRIYDLAEAELRRKIEALPIDDDAWTEELSRRRRTEQGQYCKVEFLNLSKPA